MKILMTTLAVMFFTYSNAYAGDPLDLYKEHLSVLPKAKSLDDMTQFMSSELLAHLKKKPEKEKEFFLFLTENFIRGNTEIVEEIDSDGKAVLKYNILNDVDANKNALYLKVKVTMKKENGFWKIADLEAFWRSPSDLH